MLTRMAATSTARQLIQAAQELARVTGGLRFRAPVAQVYRPLDYAWAAHESYLRNFGATRKRVVFLGMNPGPFGMAQTGVPFGEVASVRDWMGIEETVARPANEHPARPIEGFACGRSEVSGARLWGAVAGHFGSPEAFFREHFVANYCPLVFMEASGRNRTPDKLGPGERRALYAVCDEHLRRVIEILEPEWVIGIGGFAQTRAKEALDGIELQFGRVLHPSPASPLANRDWAGAAARELKALGLCPPGSQSARSRPRTKRLPT